MTTDGQNKNLENSESEGIQPPTDRSSSTEESATSSSFARRGTGPRTEQGKEKSKHNALKYGIFSKVVVLKNESQAEVDDLRNELRDYLQPEGALEEILVDKLTTLFWRLRRLLIAEADAGGRLKGDLFQLDVGSPKLDVLLRYETTLDREIERVLAQLERYQHMRRGQPVPPQVNVSVSP